MSNDGGYGKRSLQEHENKGAGQSMAAGRADQRQRGNGTKQDTASEEKARGSYHTLAAEARKVKRYVYYIGIRNIRLKRFETDETWGASPRRLPGRA